MAEIDWTNPADRQRLVGSFGPPASGCRQSQWKDPTDEVIDRPACRGRPSRGRPPAGDSACGPERMADGAERARRPSSDADRPAAPSRGRHLLQLAVELAIRVFCSGELALSLVQRLVELGTQPKARITHGTRITRITHGTRITRITHGTRITRITYGTRITRISQDHSSLWFALRMATRRCWTAAPVTDG